MLLTDLDPLKIIDHILHCKFVVFLLLLLLLFLFFFSLSSANTWEIWVSVVGLVALKNIGICYNFADNDKSFSGEILSKVILRQNTDKTEYWGKSSNSA